MTPAPDQNVVTDISPSWNANWDPSKVHLSNPAPKAAPECASKLVFSDATRDLKATTSWDEGQKAYVHKIEEDLADRFFASPAQSVDVVATCTDAEDKKGRTATFKLRLGSCADSMGTDDLVAECLVSSTTNRACAQCGDKCTKYPVPRDQELPKTCTRCGDGQVTFGENCEKPARYCSSICRCSAGSFPADADKDKDKAKGSCTANVALAGLVFETDAPVQPAWARDTLKKVADNCLKGLDKLVDFKADTAVLVQRQHNPSIVFRAAERKDAPADAPTPFKAAASAADAACVLQQDSNVRLTWAVAVAEPHCGDGAVAGLEECDTSDYCDVATCKCHPGSAAAKGRCEPAKWFLGLALQDASASKLDDKAAAAIVGDVASKCFALGEVQLGGVARSASQAAVRAEVTPAKALAPGARTPMEAVRQTVGSGACIKAVLAEHSLSKYAVSESDNPANITGFGPQPTGQAAGAVPAAVAVFAALLALFL
eukprot:m51a1_g12641 hypothetical protein (487) ;mRNA; f:1888-3911